MITLEQELDRLDNMLYENMSSYKYNIYERYSLYDPYYDRMAMGGIVIEVLIPAICTIETFKNRLEKTNCAFFETVEEKINNEYQYEIDGYSKDNKYFKVYFNYELTENSYF